MSSYTLDFEYANGFPEKEESKEKARSPDYDNILRYFPHKEVREKQEKVAHHIEAFLKDPTKKYMLLEGSTGMGKSAINLMSAQASKWAYVSTANRALQDQYIRSYGNLMTDLKGRANYKCRKSPAFNCAEAPCRKSPKGRAQCYEAQACEYHDAFNAAVSSPITSFNFASFLTFTGIWKEQFPKRNLLVVDEAHSIPEWITGHVGFSINRKKMMQLGIIDRIPDYDTPEEYYDFFMDLLDEIGSALEEGQAAYEGRVYDELENIYLKLHSLKGFVEASGDVSNFTIVKEEKRSWCNTATEGIQSVEFKPINVAKYAHELIHSKADKLIFTSATFLDFKTYWEMMGMEPDKIAIVRVGSDFPIENRPIYTSKAVGVLDYAATKFNRGAPEGPLLPEIVKAIREILALYPNDKGIIHCKPYELCQYVVRELQDDRLLFPENASAQKEILEQHFKSARPTVLISPSMTEGIDLKDEYSRFQILVKIPFPNPNDPVIARRRFLYAGYYNMKTAIEVVQAYGRSIRNETDKADTWILDTRFNRLIREDKKKPTSARVFPDWFTDAIIEE